MITTSLYILFFAVVGYCYGQITKTKKHKKRCDDIELNIADIVIIVGGMALFLAWTFLL